MLIGSGHRTANACWKDAADLHAEIEQYPQAIARYEQVANGSLNSALTKYSVKEYWLMSGLCALAMGVRTITILSCALQLNNTLNLGSHHCQA